MDTVAHAQRKSSHRKPKILPAVSWLAPRLVDRRVMRLGQELGLQDLVELLACHVALREHQVVYPCAGAQRLLRDLARARVADEGIERSHERGRLVEQAARALYVRLDAFHTPIRQRAATGGEVGEAFEEA